MQSSARLFSCAGCRAQVVICSHCDRGNLYCGQRCSQAARRQSQREAARRYQRTRRGRLCHAERQRRYRQRRTTKVTHQGSPPDRADETLPAESKMPVQHSDVSATNAADGIRCHFCARVCSQLLRQSFLHRHRTREAIDLPPPFSAPDRGP